MPRRKPVTLRRPVYIKWVDSTHQKGWIQTIDYKPLVLSDMICETIGFVISESKDVIEVCQSKQPEEYDNLMAIPMCSVREIRDLT